MLSFRSRHLCALAYKSFSSSLLTNPTLPNLTSLGLKVGALNPYYIRSMSTSTSSLAELEQKVAEISIQHVELLTATNDAYGGVSIDMKEPMDSKVFGSLLRASVSQWRQQEKKGVWLKLPIELASLIEAAVKEGFGYHHAEPKYLMLVYWIPETASTIPANASHRVGIGAFVMNSKREVLVVTENSGKFKGTGVWKLPTGVVDEGEDICAAAIREVREETGVETEFIEVLALRQSHNSFFGKSDLFFVCMLKPLSKDIQKQNSEIEEAQWMPLEEYAAQPFVQKNPGFSCVADICKAKIDKNYTGFSLVSTKTGFSAKKSYMYFNNQSLSQPQTCGDHL